MKKIRLASISKQISFTFRRSRPERRGLPHLAQTEKSGSSRGFTIMEVALAATVLALTLVGMIGVIESGTQMLDLSRKQTIANQILHSEIDQLRLQSWQTISGFNMAGSPVLGAGYPMGPTTMTSGNDPSLAQFIVNYPQTATIFTLTRTVISIAPPAASNPNQNPSSNYATDPSLLQVTFTITWTGVTGLSYSRTSTTLIGQNGLSVAYQRS
jgi:Tfp pilus assembly protein PilV